VGLFGKSPFALRLPSFFVGTLTVAATAAMGRALFSRRVGLLAAAVLSVTLWHVHLSRVGFRAVLLPLFVALTIWQVVRGIKTRRGCHWLVAGIFYGLSFYTYTASRFTPVALAAFGAYVLAARPATRPLRLLCRSSFAIRNLSLAAIATLVTVAPLAVYTMSNSDVVLGRPGQVSFLNPTINKGDPWGTLWSHTLSTLGMFFVRGDRIWRHNVPWRPIFDPVLGAAFLLGAVVALRRARRDAAAGFVLIWTAVMSLPTLLAEDAPHFLRAVGVLPVVALLPALGLEQVGRWVSGQAGKLAVLTPYSLLLIPCFLLLFGLASTTYTYFYDYARDPVAGYWFQKGAATLAGRVNGFLGTGWDGEQMMHGEPDERQVYLDPRLWEHWPSVQFLVAASDAVTIISNLQSPIPNPQVAIFTWPFEGWRQAWTLLPAPAEITFEEGPLSQGDLDPEPYPTYLAFFAASADTTAPAIARFSGSVELLGVEVSPWAGERLRVRLRWRATAPLDGNYTVFLHYLRDGERVAQADSQPIGGHYPTHQWHPGDIINDDHYVEGVGSAQAGRDALLFGFWEPESQTVLYWLDEAGNPAGDWIIVPVEPPISNLQSPRGP